MRMYCALWKLKAAAIAFYVRAWRTRRRRNEREGERERKRVYKWEYFAHYASTVRRSFRETFQLTTAWITDHCIRRRRRRRRPSSASGIADSRKPPYKVLRVLENAYLRGIPIVSIRHSAFIVSTRVWKPLPAAKIQTAKRDPKRESGISSLTKVSRSRNCFPTKLRFGGSFFSFLFSSSCSSSFANLQTRDRSSLSSSSLALNQSPTRNPIALTAASASATLMIRAASARESRPRGLVVDFCVRGN